METMVPDGITRRGTFPWLPSGGAGRLDITSPNFDSLLAKLITHAPSANFTIAVNKAYRALCEFKIEGVATNIPFLQNLLKHPAFATADIHTRFVDEHLSNLATPADTSHDRLFFERPSAVSSRAGVKVDVSDPLAVLAHGKNAAGNGASSSAPVPTLGTTPEIDVPEGMVAAQAPMQGTVVSLAVQIGDTVRTNQELLVLEAMKMEHVITAEASGVVHQLGIEVGDTIFEGHPLVIIQEQDVSLIEASDDDEVDLDHVRPDLAEVHYRHAVTFDDERRCDQRRRTGQDGPRNVDDLRIPARLWAWLVSPRYRRAG